MTQGPSTYGVAGILLTGGTSGRMGFDKTSFRIDGVPCAQRIARVMCEVLDPVIEVGPGRSGLPAVLEHPKGSGPLAALSAGFAELCRKSPRERAAVVVAGDLAFVTEVALRMLADWNPQDRSIVPVVNGRAQPLCARWSVADLRHAEGLVAGGHRSMQRLLSRPGVVMVDESKWPDGVDSRAFSDIDTPDDLERFGLWS